MRRLLVSLAAAGLIGLGLTLPSAAMPAGKAGFVAATNTDVTQVRGRGRGGWGRGGGHRGGGWGRGRHRGWR